jgi:hypothetical protein
MAEADTLEAPLPAVGAENQLAPVAVEDVAESEEDEAVPANARAVILVAQHPNVVDVPRTLHRMPQ